ncbi:MAG: hypothetical protein RIS75_303, partial [Actinomycetota bacterium]
RWHQNRVDSNALGEVDEVGQMYEQVFSLSLLFRMNEY